MSMRFAIIGLSAAEDLHAGPETFTTCPPVNDAHVC